MSLHDLTPPEGARHRKKRKGRGPASGNGKTSGKGHKGQKARSGGKVALGFEGGQMPLHRRLPKRGFGNGKFRKVWETVNVRDLERFEAGSVVDWDALNAAGLVRKPGSADGVKVLGEGELTVALTVKASKFSAGARAKIEAAGGSIEEV